MADSPIFDLPAIPAIQDDQKIALDGPDLGTPTSNTTFLDVSTYVLSKLSFNANSILLSDASGSTTDSPLMVYAATSNNLILGGSASLADVNLSDMFIGLSEGIRPAQMSKYAALNSFATVVNSCTYLTDIMTTSCAIAGSSRVVAIDCNNTSISNCSDSQFYRCASSTVNDVNSSYLTCLSSTASTINGSHVDVQNVTAANINNSVVFSRSSTTPVASLSGFSNLFVAANFDVVQLRSANGVLIGNNDLSNGVVQLSETGYLATGTARKEKRLVTLNAFDFTNHNVANLYLTMPGVVNTAEEATFVFPAGFDSSITVIDLDIYYVPTDSNAGNVNFRAGLTFAKPGGIVISTSLVPDSPVRVDVASQAVTAVSGTADALVKATVSLNVDFTAVPYTIEPYDYVLCRIQRAGADAADTYLSDVHLYNVGLRGVCNTLGKDI